MQTFYAYSNPFLRTPCILPSLVDTEVATRLSLDAFAKECVVEEGNLEEFFCVIEANSKDEAHIIMVDAISKMINHYDELIRFTKGTVMHDKTEEVKDPAHYKLINNVESIDIIAATLTKEAWYGFCMGNIIKYRLRAGKKGDASVCLAKANQYEELFEQKKHLCKNN